MPSQGYYVLILGGGVAGLTTAMALAKFAPPTLQPSIKVFEIRPQPGVIGGAINLTPNALRLLDHLGVLPIIKRRQFGVNVNAVEIFSIYKPYKLAESSFRGPNDEGIGEPPYKALRITRASLMEALVEAVSNRPNITFTCGKQAMSISETAFEVAITFSDDSVTHGDMLLGCDGVHSFTRNHYVDPDRKQQYCGVANAFGFLSLADGQEVHFEASALNFARRGMLLTSYYEQTKTQGYVGAVIEMPDVGSRDMWKTKGSDQASVRANIQSRFGGATLPAVKTFIDGARDWFMWPIYALSAGGQWATDRVMLLGDAAHAMPPQGESTGIVLEDGVLFARCLARNQVMHGSVKDAFDAYERLRRGRINTAFTESQNVVKSVKDAGWLGDKLRALVVPWYLRWSRRYREKHFIEDVTNSPLGFADDIDAVQQTESNEVSGAAPVKKWATYLISSEVLTIIWSYVRSFYYTRTPVKRA